MHTLVNTMFVRRTGPLCTYPAPCHCLLIRTFTLCIQTRTCPLFTLTSRYTVHSFTDRSTVHLPGQPHSTFIPGQIYCAFIYGQVQWAYIPGQTHRAFSAERVHCTVDSDKLRVVLLTSEGPLRTRTWHTHCALKPGLAHCGPAVKPNSTLPQRPPIPGRPTGLTRAFIVRTVGLFTQQAETWRGGGLLRRPRLLQAHRPALALLYAPISQNESQMSSLLVNPLPPQECSVLY